MTTVSQRGASVAFPGDPAFDAATQVFNLAAPAQPVAAVTARTVAQVQAAVRHAAAAGLAVRMHTTGHASATARPMRGALLIRTDLAGGVEVDLAARVARIPAGTRWGAVVDAVAPHGLAAPHGSAATVGVVGYLLRGGLSFYGRKVGLAVNSVRAVELITADGELRRVDATQDPELFWAVRGGGGGFGVVTAVEVALFPATAVVTGSTYWPAAAAPGLLRAWRRWAKDAPEQAATSFRVMNLPPLEEIPPALRSGTVVGVDGVLLAATGDDIGTARQQAEDLLGPLRAVAEPVFDSWEQTTPAGVLHVHMDPPDPVPIAGDHLLLAEIGEDGAAQFLRVLGEGSGSPLVVAGLRQLGGACAVPDPAGGALRHLQASYAYSGAGVPLDAASERAIRRHCALVRAALARWDTGRTAPTFVESLEQPQGHLDADTVRAVDRIRARVDPTGLFADDILPGCFSETALNRPAAAR
jgi:FAD/FMN-containing dehydrogenase